MRWLAALVLALTVAACGAGGHPAAKAKASHTPTYADPNCPVVLSVIPASPPRNANQALALTKELSTDQGVLGGLPRGSLLLSLADGVGADALKLYFALGPTRSITGGSTSSDLATYNSDVAQLRQYCQG
jgi:hypothetical protein